MEKSISKWMDHLDPDRYYFWNENVSKSNIIDSINFDGAKRYIFLDNGFGVYHTLHEEIHTFIIWTLEEVSKRTIEKQQAFKLPVPFDLQNKIKTYI